MAHSARNTFCTSEVFVFIDSTASNASISTRLRRPPFRIQYAMEQQKRTHKEGLLSEATRIAPDSRPSHGKGRYQLRRRIRPCLARIFHQRPRFGPTREPDLIAPHETGRKYDSIHESVQIIRSILIQIHEFRRTPGQNREIIHIPIHEYKPAQH